MKPLLLQIEKKTEQSFSFRHDIVPFFYNKWHYHTEIELVYILKGTGSQFVGDSITAFNKGTLVMVGSCVPHFWQSDEVYTKKLTTEKCEAYVIHFLPNFLGDIFFNLPETKQIQKLFIKALRGICFNGRTKKIIIDKLIQLKNTTVTSSNRIVLLLDILHTLSNCKDVQYLCAKPPTIDFNKTDTDRMNNVYQFVLEHFTKPIKLNEVAAIAHLTTNSFCRYFKSRTKKSFSRFLIEIRISYACKLLIESDNSVTSICYSCGYNSFSNFSYHFKLITKQTPLQYRKLHYVEE